MDALVKRMKAHVAALPKSAPKNVPVGPPPLVEYAFGFYWGTREVRTSGDQRVSNMALVDLMDIDACSEFGWWLDKGKGQGQRVITELRKSGVDKCIPLGVFILARKGTPVTSFRPLPDHSNGNSFDNRRSNLRPASYAENAQNSRRKVGKGGFRGVRPNRWGRFAAEITCGGVKMYLGTFGTDIEAALAYNEAALRYHGEFAVLNVIR